jgi:hypothetical protein
LTANNFFEIHRINVSKGKNMSVFKSSRSFFLSLMMGVFLAAPCAVKANTLKIQSIGSKIGKINVPLDTPKVLFHVDNIHSKYALGFAAVSFLKN